MNKTELLIHPLRLRILQHLSVYKEATTNEIISVLPEVSKASVYNHIKLLESNHIIQVVHENRIRGTVEKTYALNKAEKNNDFSCHYYGISRNITVIRTGILLRICCLQEEITYC